MSTFKVEHVRNDCIGCGACAAVCPMWEMDDNDGKSNLKGAKKNADGIEELEIGDKDLDSMKESAESCPVNVIHITNNESKEKII